MTVSAPALLTSLEIVALLRDVVLIAFFALGFLALFLFSVLAILLYRRLVRVLDRTERALTHTEAATEAIAESIGVVSQWAGTFSLASFVSRIFSRKDGS